jgi:hypothetical protein
MKKHILLDRAISYKFPETVASPKDCIYDPVVGYWVNKKTGIAMMLSDSPEKMETKKCDVETGEDQKGE